MCVARSRSGWPEIQLRCCSGRLPLQGDVRAEVFRRLCVVARSAARTTTIGGKCVTSLELPRNGITLRVIRGAC